MFSLFKVIIKSILFPSKSEYEEDSNLNHSLHEYDSVSPTSSAYFVLYDCVMRVDKYEQVQKTIKANLEDVDFNFHKDVGVIVGTSYDQNQGLDYVTAWYDEKQPENPKLVACKPEDLISIASPLAAIQNRGAKLDTLFKAYFENILDTLDPNYVPEN